MKAVDYIKKHKILLICLLLFFLYLFWPVGKLINPVPSTAPNNYQESFGMPWGDHRHRGLDIFAPTGAPIVSVSKGWVIRVIPDDGKYQGGNTVEILGMGGRIYHYAHMSKIIAKSGSFVNEGDTIGLVGRTGNASRPGCPPHLHFSIVNFIPHFDNKDVSIFMIDPAKEINNNKKL